MDITKLLSGVCALALAAPAGAADPIKELSAFSVFDSINLAELAKGDAKTVKGPAMSNPRFLSVQSVYVVPGSPGQLIAAQKRWNPARHRELKVSLHSDLSGSPNPADFSALQKAPDNRAVKSLVGVTEKMSSDVQVSKEEAKKFSAAEGKGGAVPPAVANFWSEILAGRARAYLSGGTAAQPPYDHSANVRPNDELTALLRQQDKLRKQFGSFLSDTGIGRGAGSLSPEMYWELLEVDDQGLVTLGASYARSGQAADALYYASGGYYVALTLYQMWPVRVEGKEFTLVWRGDMISSAALAELHGVERLASEGAMIKDISKAIALFRKDSGR